MIAIGVPTVGEPSWAFVESLLRLRTPNGGYRLLRRGPLGVDVARNMLVRDFLATDAQWLLMVDSDAVLHGETLMRLLSWERPVVSALAFSRYGPLMPTVYRDRDPGRDAFWRVRLDVVRAFADQHRELYSSLPVVVEPRPEDALYQVDRTGCHCVLLRRDVLEAIPAPWFVADPDKHNREDFYFYEQVERAGFEVYVDLSCMASHLYGARPLAMLDHSVWDAAAIYAPATTAEAAAERSEET